MIPQSKSEFHIKAAAGNRYQVLDRNQHNRGTFATREEAAAHLATLTAARPQTRRAVQTLAHAAQPGALVGV